jgi:hypothetical protein
MVAQMASTKTKSPPAKVTYVPTADLYFDAKNPRLADSSYLVSVFKAASGQEASRGKHWGDS